MIIGVPKEIKPQEQRISLTPAAVHEVIQCGHTVLVQSQAGEGSGFSDKEYQTVGAQILKNIHEVYAQADMIVKVKEPLEAEYKLIKKGQILLSFFHFASSAVLTQAMIASQSVCVAYETVENHKKQLPLLTPMSEVAGRMAIQQGIRFLESSAGGIGLLLGGVTGVEPVHVLILGAGSVGTEAAKIAAGLGAQVTLLDKDLDRLRYLSEVLPKNVRPLVSNPHLIEKCLSTHQLIIGAVLIKGAKAPHIINRAMLSKMKAGTVLVDVSVDQGGCFETTRPTTHEHPIYHVDGIMHYCVANMPGAVPKTSTLALTNATLPYVIELANKGWRQACKQNQKLCKGLNIVEGKVVYPAVSEVFQVPHTPAEEVLSLA